MESTGNYWIALYEILEATPEKLALLRTGFLNASFVPEKSLRELRHLSHYRKSIVHDITSQKNRIAKFLQSSGSQLSSFCFRYFWCHQQGNHPPPDQIWPH